jgi:nucleoside 2-deoxyribosyltransferase
MKIYLAGFMSAEFLEETTGWRKQIREHYKMKDWPITFLDPYNGKDLETISLDGLTSSIPAQALVHRDYMSVSNADIIVANLKTFGSKRTPTGTICEICWAWQMHKPLILITDEEQYKKHPFTSYFASSMYDNVEDMLEDKILEYFFKGLNNAKYS